MSRFYRIQIDSIYLTSTGLAGGTPCKLTVPGLEDLLTPIAGIVEQSASGIPQFQTLAWIAGKQFEINIEVLPEQVWTSIKSLINSALANNESFTITGTGDVGDFFVTAMPFPNKPFQAAEFINGRIKGATLRFITTIFD